MSTTHQSPSSKYALTIDHGGDAWESRGTVTDADGRVIVVIERNYSCFPFLFIENHPNGKTYFVAGADYQGQTVVELGTGARRDYLPDEAQQGHAFCWGDYTFDQASQLLVVDGCYWACPYMIRFYDFSDPMNGWPDVEAYASETDDNMEWIDPDVRAPEIRADGTIVTYQSEQRDATASDMVIERPLPPIAATRTWRRDGNKLILVSEDVTPAEQERRRKADEDRAAYEAFTANYQATDPLWLRMMALVAQPPFKPDYISIGQTHKEWCPHWLGDERRFCRYVHKEDALRIAIEIAHATGPVKLDVWRNDENATEWFEHSVAGVDAAMARACELIHEPS